MSSGLQSSQPNSATCACGRRTGIKYRRADVLPPTTRDCTFIFVLSTCACLHKFLKGILCRSTLLGCHWIFDFTLGRGSFHTFAFPSFRTPPPPPFFSPTDCYLLVQEGMWVCRTLSLATRTFWYWWRTFQSYSVRSLRRKGSFFQQCFISILYCNLLVNTRGFQSVKFSNYDYRSATFV